MMMDKDEAVREVKNLGGAYFYDNVVIGEKVTPWDMTDDEILAEIQEHIRRNPSSAMVFWAKWRDALRQVLAECSKEELDQIMGDFGHAPEEVGGSRKFLSRLYELMDRAIDERNSELSLGGRG